MAQAARQNLRMQKELKLLLTDPPPGVSLPNDPSDLSNINAEMKGPEGTVYADGVFKIKIQIPERYPFQPPNVTFATPIYHPNIDNGGRICLDILKLPPKGAWQPSLNISTVLMSIGLLLSEPNPDDGLMCEASREYKYNSQMFDQKARSFTERYAKSGINGSSSSSGNTPVNPTQNTMVAEDWERRNDDANCNLNRRKLGKVSLKLSLESSVPSQKGDDDDKEDEGHTKNPSLSVKSSTCLSMLQVGIHDEQLPCEDNTNEVGKGSINTSSKKCGSKNKLSLKSSILAQVTASKDKENVLQNPSLQMNSKTFSMASFNPFQPGTGNLVDRQHKEDHEKEADSGSVNQCETKPSGFGGKLSLNSSCPRLSLSNSEGLSSMSSSKSVLTPETDNSDKQPLQVNNDKVKKGATDMSIKKSGICKKLSLETFSTFRSEDYGNKENVPPNCQSTLESRAMISSYSDAQPPYQGHIQAVKLVGQKKSFGMGEKAPMESSCLTQKKDADHKGTLLGAGKLSLPYSRSVGVPSQSMQLPHTRKHGDQIYAAEKAGNSIIKQNKEVESTITEAVIVLDSEDSDEEVQEPRKSRLCIARKPLVGKRKAKA